MTLVAAVIKKELLDALRDGKSMATAFLIPIIFALVSFGFTHFAVSLQDGSKEISLPVKGQHLAAPLIAYLKESGISIVKATDNPEQAIIDRQIDMILVIPEDFPSRFREQNVAALNLLSDHSRTQSRGKVTRIKALIEQWSMSTGALRLITRNISPEIANPIKVNSVNVTSDQRVASKILAGLPMFILMIAFASGIGIIADMASGERERRSLEPLLINPISHQMIFFGKWAAAVFVTSIVSAIGVALQFISINLSPIAQLGLRLEMGIDKFFVIFLLLIPIICFAVALQLFISFFARSFKDAQSYNSLVIMLPMAPGLYLTFNSGSAEFWQMFVPVLGPTALFVDIIGGDGAAIGDIFLASATSLICAAICAYAGITLLKREKTIFG